MLDNCPSPNNEMMYMLWQNLPTLALYAMLLACVSCKLYSGDTSQDKQLGRLISRTAEISAALAKQIDAALKKLFTRGEADEITTLIRKGGKQGNAAIAALRTQIAVRAKKVNTAVAALHSNIKKYPTAPLEMFAPFRDDLDAALDELLALANRQYSALPRIAGADDILHQKLLFDFDTKNWAKQLAAAGYYEPKVVAKVTQLQQMSTRARRRSDLRAFLQRTDNIPLTNKGLSKLPAWEIVAPDGSKHYMMGTIHGGIPKDAVLAHPELKRIMQKATLFMPENDAIDDMMRVFRTQLKHPLAEEIMSYKGNLRTELGDVHWQKLEKELPLEEQLTLTKASKEELNEMGMTYDEFIQALKAKHEKVHPSSVLDILRTNARANVALDVIDEVMFLFAKQNGKKIVPLEDLEIAVDFALNARKNINTVWLKDTLDSGGTSYLRNTHHHMVNSYTSGNFEDVLLISHLLEQFPKELLEKRNRLWVENILSNCQQGENCFIFGGLAHMLEHGDNVVNLLQAKGFQVKALF